MAEAARKISFTELAKAAIADGRYEEAKEAYEAATTGTDEPAGRLFYNDQPADMIMYQGLALKELGEPEKSRALLLSHGTRVSGAR